MRTIMAFEFFLAIFGTDAVVHAVPTRFTGCARFLRRRPFGPFINRHHFAAYMEMALALPLGLRVYRFGGEEKKFIYLFAAGLMGVALVMTNSRGGIISLVARNTLPGRHHGTQAAPSQAPASRRSDQPRFKSAAMKAGLALALIVAMFGSVVLLGGEEALSRFVGYGQHR